MFESNSVLGANNVKQIFELHAAGQSARTIARTLGISRNSVRRYLQEPGMPRPQPRPKRGSKLDAHSAYIQQQLGRGMDNCQVMLRELRAQGYSGSYTTLKNYVQPYRRRRQTQATVRFETKPGEQAQVDFGLFRYELPDGSTRSIWAFVMVLSWSRAMYVEFIRRADVATFIRCHIHAFERLGGVTRRCLYDNAKVVVLGRDDAGQPIWNSRFLDFALRMGFGIQLCHPYRPQTKGRVEAGVKYVRRNFWPTARFVDDADLNRQVQAWVDGVAHQRQHGTTCQIPGEQLLVEQPSLQPCPGRDKLQPFLREERPVGRDGYLKLDGSWYGVSCQWAGKPVQIDVGQSLVQVWAGEQRLAVHPRATHAGQRFPIPGQWAGVSTTTERPKPEPLASQVPVLEVERRSLAVYDDVLQLAS